jgi:transcriptional regulator with XRE-family HTH domain
MVRQPLTPHDVRRGQCLGRLLRQARGDRSMLTTALAAGLSPETLRKIESGRVPTPSFATVAALADVLGLSLDGIWAEINRTVVSEGASGAAEPVLSGTAPGSIGLQVRNACG